MPLSVEPHQISNSFCESFFVHPSLVFAPCFVCPPSFGRSIDDNWLKIYRDPATHDNISSPFPCPRRRHRTNGTLSLQGARCLRVDSGDQPFEPSAIKWIPGSFGDLVGLCFIFRGSPRNIKHNCLEKTQSSSTSVHAVLPFVRSFLPGLVHQLCLFLSRPAKLVNMSISEEDKRYSDLDKYDTEHLYPPVSRFSYCAVRCTYLAQFNRIVPPTTTTTMTIPILTQVQAYWKMSHRTQKSGLLWPTQTIPRCLHPLCVLGSSVAFGLSLFPPSTNFSTSDTLA